MTLQSQTGSSAAWLPVPSTERAAVASCFLLNGVLFAAWVSRIPTIQRSLGLDHAAFGFALFGVALGALCFMPLAGWFISRVGSRRVTQAAAILYCAALPWLALASNFWMLAIALFLFGGAHGAFDVAMNAQAVAVEERYRRPIMSSLHALWSVGGLVGAGIGGFIASTGCTPAAHFTGTALVLGAAMAFYSLPRLLDAGEELNRLVPGESVERPRRSVWMSRKLFVLGLIAFCIMMGEGAMADWSAIFLRENTGATDAMAAAGYAAFSLAMAAVRFSGDFLSARIGAVAMVRGGGALAALGLGIALLDGGTAMALAGFAAAGAGFATIVPAVFSAAGRLPGVEPGPALAAASTVGYSGFLIGPPAIGFAAEFLGLRLALAIVVGMSLLVVVLAHHIRRQPSVTTCSP